MGTPIRSAVCTPARRSSRASARSTPDAVGEQCGICLELLQADAVEAGQQNGVQVSLCGHVFHEACLAGWRTHSHGLGKVTLCPICRSRAGSSPSPVHAAYGALRARTPGALFSPYESAVFRPTRLASNDLLRITHARAAVRSRQFPADASLEGPDDALAEGDYPNFLNSAAFLQQLRVQTQEPIPESQEDLASQERLSQTDRLSQENPEVHAAPCEPGLTLPAMVRGIVTIVDGMDFDTSPVERQPARPRIRPGVLSAPTLVESPLGADFFATPSF